MTQKLTELHRLARISASIHRGNSIAVLANDLPQIAPPS
jgi:hypothetical protein